MTSVADEWLLKTEPGLSADSLFHIYTIDSMLKSKIVLFLRLFRALTVFSMEDIY